MAIKVRIVLLTTFPVCDFACRRLWESWRKRKLEIPCYNYCVTKCPRGIISIHQEEFIDSSTNHKLTNLFFFFHLGCRYVFIISLSACCRVHRKLSCLHKRWCTLSLNHILDIFYLEVKGLPIINYYKVT